MRKPSWRPNAAEVIYLKQKKAWGWSLFICRSWFHISVGTIRKTSNKVHNSMQLTHNLRFIWYMLVGNWGGKRSIYHLTGKECSKSESTEQKKNKKWIMLEEFLAIAYSTEIQFLKKLTSKVTMLHFKYADETAVNTFFRLLTGQKHFP